jgi:hypothetical protein
LATIKYLGKCPCPRCILKKGQINELGTKQDANCRIKLNHIDTLADQEIVEKARKHVFQGFKVDGSKVGGGFIGLDSESRVPTQVGFLSIYSGKMALTNCRMLSPSAFFHSASTII